MFKFWTLILRWVSNIKILIHSINHSIITEIIELPLCSVKIEGWEINCVFVIVKLILYTL